MGMLASNAWGVGKRHAHTQPAGRASGGVDGNDGEEVW